LRLFSLPFERLANHRFDRPKPRFINRHLAVLCRRMARRCKPAASVNGGIETRQFRLGARRRLSTAARACESAPKPPGEVPCHEPEIFCI